MLRETSAVQGTHTKRMMGIRVYVDARELKLLHSLVGIQHSPSEVNIAIFSKQLRHLFKKYGDGQGWAEGKWRLRAPSMTPHLGLTFSHGAETVAPVLYLGCVRTSEQKVSIAPHNRVSGQSNQNRCYLEVGPCQLAVVQGFHCLLKKPLGWSRSPMCEYKKPYSVDKEAVLGSS